MYNATIYEYDENGKPYSTFVAEVAEIGGELQMLRSNSIQFTGYEGKTSISQETGKEIALYQLYLQLRLPAGHTLQIVKDNCRGYKQVLSGLALPPAYKI